MIFFQPFRELFFAFCLVILTLFSWQATFGQDTLYLRNGDVINAHVKSIDQSTITYSKFENPAGSDFSIEKIKILKIIYRNGREERFMVNSEKDQLRKISNDSFEDSQAALFLEIGGNAYLLSLNADYTFYRNSEKQFAMTGRVGFGLPVSESGAIIPITMSALFGNSIHLEVGGGITYFVNPTSHYNSENVVVTGILGIRSQRSNRAFYKVALTPFFAGNQFLLWGGLSLGYSF